MTTTSKFKAFWKDTRAAAAIEFALVAPLYVAFFCGMLEIGLMWWGNSVINNVMAQVARIAPIGCAHNKYLQNGGGLFCMSESRIDENYIKQAIVNRSLGFVQANSSRFEIYAANAYQFFGDGVSNMGAADPDSITTSFDVGTLVSGYRLQDSFIVVHTTYTWPHFFPLARLMEAFNQPTVYSNIIFYRNEKFGALDPM